MRCCPSGRIRSSIRHFDPEEELQRSGKDYLVVMSRPPHAVAVGQTLEYQVAVKANNDKVEYRLDSGPEGMTISPSGLLRWEVKTPPPIGIAQVNISVTGGDQTVRQNFTLAVQSSGETPPVVVCNPCPSRLEPHLPPAHRGGPERLAGRSPDRPSLRRSLSSADRGS